MNKMSIKDINKIMKNVSKRVYIGDDTYYEEFKQVIYKNIPTSYIISSHGRFFNSSFHGKKGDLRQIKTRLDKDGYEVVGICIDGLQKHVKIHRLVAKAFIPNPKHKPEVNHINGIKNDNGIWNLEWATGQENMRHALANGLKIPLHGEEVYNSIYTEKDVIKIAELLLKNKSFDYIKKKTGATSFMIHYVLRKKRWKHITKNYNFDDYHFGKNVKKIKKICKLLESNKYNQTEIANMTNTDVRIVNNILTGHSHRDISKSYNLNNFNKYGNRYRNKE